MTDVSGNDWKMRVTGPSVETVSGVLRFQFGKVKTARSGASVVFLNWKKHPEKKLLTYTNILWIHWLLKKMGKNTDVFRKS